MTTTVWLILIAAVGLVWIVAVWINRRRVHAYHNSGDPDADIVIFAEPVRWLFIIWGFASFSRGLRQTGAKHRLHLFCWSSTAGALLAIPDLVRHRWQKRKADALARRIQTLAAQHPGRTIHLVGYSSGTFIVLEACRRLSCPQAIGKVILLAGSVSPTYRLDDLPPAVTELHNFYSPLDMITGIGPLLFGSNDRRWTPGCGNRGFASSPPILTQHRWKPAHAALGYLGDHFSIVAPPFIANKVATILT